MKLASLAIVLIAISMGTSAYYHTHIQALKENILIADQACLNKVTDLERRYKTRMQALLVKLPEQQVMHGQEAVALDKAKLDNMVSYGHQVRAVSHKYEFLLESAQIDETERKRLRRLLVEREIIFERIDGATGEHAALSMGDLKSNLETVEESIEEMLIDPIDYDRYKYLKERSL